LKKGQRDKMEKDNSSDKGSSDYSCSPVTKNELLTAAKYRAIKFAIVLAPAISIPLFRFICSKPLSRLRRVLHQHRVTGNRRMKRKFRPAASFSPPSSSPIFLRESQFLRDSSWTGSLFLFVFSSSSSLHFLYISFIIISRLRISSFVTPK